MKPLLKTIAAGCSGLALLSLCMGPSASAESLLLRGATVHTIAGDTLAPGEVRVQDGKIAAVGATLPAAGAQVVDLAGLHLYPALIDLCTVLGLTEIEEVRATQDSTEVGDFTPDVESWVAINPDSELLPVTRANGIGFFEPIPKGGVVAGQSALLRIDGWTAEQMVVRKPLALHLFWPSAALDTSPRTKGRTKSAPKPLSEQAKTRSAKVRSTVDFFEEARAYARAKTAAADGQAKAPQIVPAWEAMLPYVRGQLPVVVHADDIREIEAVLAWSATNGCSVVLAGARDAWKAAAAIASRRLPVVYTHTFTQPLRDADSYDVHFAAPALLHRAGVKVIFSTGPSVFETPMACNLPYAAAQAVAFGLPKDEALKGLTLYPTEIAGVTNRLGSLDVGKEATLFAASGDILDIRAQVKRFWFQGKEVSLSDRQTRLYDKYRNRPK